MIDDELPLSSSISDSLSQRQRPGDPSSERLQKIPRVDCPIEEDEEQDQQKDSIFSETKMNPNSRIQRYLIAVEYIGTRFAGAQQQSNCRTVVGVLRVKFCPLHHFHKF